MAGQIGKATIEIVADLSKFPADLKAKLKAAFAEGVKGVDIETPLAVKAEKAGEKAATKASKGFMSKARGEFRRAGTLLGRDMFTSLGNIFSRSSAAGRGGGLTGFIRNAFSSAQDAFKSGIQGLQSAGQGLGSALGSLSGGGDITSLVKVTAIVALIPAVLGLAGALVHLSGILLALPAAIGFVGAALAPLIIGFRGFGAAIGAGFSGDVDKFNEALKGLAPSARAVVKEIVGFRKPLSQLRKDVQQGLFTELVGQVKPTLAKIIPILSRGLVQVATSFSAIFAEVAKALRDPAVLGALQALFFTTSNILDKIGPPLVRLFRAFFIVIGAGLPFLERMFTGLGNGVGKFAGWLEQIVKDGRFNRFLENAIMIGKDLLDLLGAVGGLIKVMFGGQDVADASGGFIKSIQEAVDNLTAFFKTADGQRTLDNMVRSIKAVGAAIIILIDIIIFVQRAVFAFIDAVKAAGEAITGFFSSIGAWISGAWQTVVDFFTNLPTTVSIAVGMLVDTVTFRLGQLIGTFLAFPFLAWQAIQAFPGLISGVIKSGIDSAEHFVRDGLNRVWGLISSLPGRVRGLGPALLDAARSLGRRIGEGLSEIGNFASDIGHKIVSTVRGGINRIIDGINGGIADIDSKIPIGLPRLPHLERGGVIDSPTVALIGEKGKREVVLPLTDPQRTRELAQQSGLTKILGSGGGAPTVNLTAILDGFGLINVIDMRVDAALGDQGSELAFGART